MLKQKKIILIGSNSNLLCVVAEKLAKKNFTVEIVSEFEYPNTALKTAAVKVFHCDLDDAAILYEAVKEADTIIITPFLRIKRPDAISDSKSSALTLVEVLGKLPKARIINLSSLGSHLERDAGLLECFRYQERVLNGLANAEVYHLRAGYYLNNFIELLPTLNGGNVLRGFLPEDIPFFSSTYDDVAFACVDLVQREVNQGSISVLDIRHDQLLSPRKIARYLAIEIGEDSFSYSRFSNVDALNFLQKKGYSISSAKKELQMYDAFYTASCVIEVLRGNARLTPIPIQTLSSEFFESYKKYKSYASFLSLGVTRTHSNIV